MVSKNQIIVISIIIIAAVLAIVFLSDVFCLMAACPPDEQDERDTFDVEEITAWLGHLDATPEYGDIPLIFTDTFEFDIVVAGSGVSNVSCDENKKAVVIGMIKGGIAGNSYTVIANCDSNLVVSEGVVDFGGGAVNVKNSLPPAPQIRGTASCDEDVTLVGNSKFAGLCLFNLG